MQLITKKCIY